jgi:hypothetical protein
MVGSFLPWEHGGDFLPYWIYGIRVLTFRPPKSIENPLLWMLVTSALLAVSSLFFVIKWLAHRLEAGSGVGSPVIQIGLIGVVVGAGFLLFGTVKNYRQAKVALQ